MFLLVGNDWLIHVVLGAFLAWKFGWLGVLIAFLSHFVIIDTIPHGHLQGLEQGIKTQIWETLKGNLIGLFIFVYSWAAFDFTQAVLIGCEIFISVLPDFILKTATIIDKKMVWEKFNDWKRNIIFDYVYINIWLNYFFHWFGRSTELTYFLELDRVWKEVDDHNCGITGNGIKISWWNILQPIILTIFILITW